jgi:hypothetical protein
MNIDATQVGTAPHQQIPNLEMSLISITTAGKSSVSGYFSFRWLLEVGIRQGQPERPYFRHMIPNQALTRVPIPTYFSEADPGQAPQMYLLCESKRAQWDLRAMLAITVPKIAVFTQPQAKAAIQPRLFKSSGFPRRVV